MENVIEYQMKRTNRNLFVANAILLAFVLFIAYVILGVIPFQSGGWLFMIIGTPFFLIATFNIRKAIRRDRTSLEHPIYKSLSFYGNPDASMVAIQNEFRLQERFLLVSKVALTKSWLLIPHLFSASFVPLSYIIWVFKRRTKTSINFVPVGSSYESVIVTRNGRQFDIRNTHARVNKILEAIHERVPWIKVGYSEDLMDLFNTNLKEFVLRIDARKIELFQEVKR